ncbi:hypothetical protein WA158_000161 [Blastocystis sp. Blastoise]
MDISKGVAGYTELFNIGLKNHYDTREELKASFAAYRSKSHFSVQQRGGHPLKYICNTDGCLFYVIYKKNGLQFDVTSYMCKHNHKPTPEQSYDLHTVYNSDTKESILKISYTKTTYVYEDFEEKEYDSFLNDPFGMYSRNDPVIKALFPFTSQTVIDHWYVKLFSRIYGAAEEEFKYLPSMLLSVKYSDEIDYKLYIDKNNRSFVRLIVIYKNIVVNLEKLFNNEIYIDATHSQSKDKFLIYNIVVLSSYNKKYLLGYMIDLGGESSYSWEDFFLFLVSHGMNKDAKYVIHSDGLIGLTESIKRVFVNATNVMCLFHARCIMYRKMCIKESAYINHIFFEYSNAETQEIADTLLYTEMEEASHYYNDETQNNLSNIIILSCYLQSCDKKFCRFMHAGFNLTILSNNPTEQIHSVWAKVVRKSSLAMFPFFYHLENIKMMITNCDNILIKGTMPNSIHQKIDALDVNQYIINSQGINKFYVFRIDEMIVYTIQYIPTVTLVCNCSRCATEVLCDHCLFFIKQNDIKFENIPTIILKRLYDSLNVNICNPPVFYRFVSYIYDPIITDSSISESLSRMNKLCYDVIDSDHIFITQEMQVSSIENSTSQSEVNLESGMSQLRELYSSKCSEDLIKKSINNIILDKTIQANVINVKTGEYNVITLPNEITIGDIKIRISKLLVTCKFVKILLLSSDGDLYDDSIRIKDIRICRFLSKLTILMVLVQAPFIESCKSFQVFTHLPYSSLINVKQAYMNGDLYMNLINFFYDNNNNQYNINKYNKYNNIYNKKKKKKKRIPVGDLTNYAVDLLQQCEIIPLCIQTLLNILSDVYKLNILWDKNLTYVYNEDISKCFEEFKEVINYEDSTINKIDDTYELKHSVVESNENKSDRSIPYEQKTLDNIVNTNLNQLNVNHEAQNFVINDYFALSDDSLSVDTIENDLESGISIISCASTTTLGSTNDDDDYKHSLYNKATNILTNNNDLSALDDLYINDFIIDTYSNYIWLINYRKYCSDNSKNYIYIINYYERKTIDNVNDNDKKHLNEIIEKIINCNTSIVIIPYLIHNHWILFTVQLNEITKLIETAKTHSEPNKKNITLRCYDSNNVGLNTHNANISEFTMRLITRIIALNCESTAETSKLIDSFKHVNIQIQICKSPQQKNGYDCGIFVLKNIEYIAKNLLSWFTNSSINYECKSHEVRNEINEKLKIMCSLEGYDSVKRRFSDIPKALLDIAKSDGSRSVQTQQSASEISDYIIEDVDISDNAFTDHINASCEKIINKKHYPIKRKYIKINLSSQDSEESVINDPNAKRTRHAKRFTPRQSGYEEGPVERLKANIIEIISTMESRNNLLFLPYAKTITEKVWNILSDVKYKEEDRYNTIYKNRLTYFASMSKLPSNQSLFTGESLKIIIQNIIIPCLLFTDDDMNNYEDMPYEYIQNELEDANCNSCKRGVMMYFNYDINANNVSFLGAVESLPMAGKRSMPLSIYVYIFWIPNSDARHQRL